MGSMSRFRFHVSLHALPTGIAAGTPLTIDGRTIQTLQVTPAQLAKPLPITFEESCAALEQLPRMFVEPDGSFVWVSSAGEPRWQVDGQLVDRGGRLMLVDLKGECTGKALQSLLDALGGHRSPLMFQLVRQAVFLDEAQFRCCAAVDPH
jgi:hypothetical protein